MMVGGQGKLSSLPGEPFGSKADGKGWPHGLDSPCHFDPLLAQRWEPEVEHR